VMGVILGFWPGSGLRSSIYL